MNEWEKGQSGYLYDANNDPEITRLREDCADRCHEYNQYRPSEREQRHSIMKRLLGCIRGRFEILPPFHCDYGVNIEIGDNFFANYNCTILDGAKVTIGDNVLIAPNCVITTAGHPLDREQRAAGLEIARPITIGDDVWIGANVTVLPGVTIGSGAVVGAGSVVNRDIPAGVVAAGVPCRVIRKITEADRDKYPMY